MRITGFILSYYLILLAAVPCCLLDNCPEVKKEQSAKHESGDDDCGSCSPFFSCEGCAAATIACEPVQFVLNIPEQQTVFTCYQQSSLPEVDYDFWQPPKRG